MWASIWAYLTEWALAKTKTFWVDLALVGLVFVGGCFSGCECERHRPHIFGEGRSEVAAIQDFRGNWSPPPPGWENAQVARRVDEPMPVYPLPRRPCGCDFQFVVIPQWPDGDWHPVGEWWEDQDYSVGTERVMHYSADAAAARMWVGADLSAISYRWDAAAKRWLEIQTPTESPEPPLAPEDHR